MNYVFIIVSVILSPLSWIHFLVYSVEEEENNRVTKHCSFKSSFHHKYKDNLPENRQILDDLSILLFAICKIAICKISKMFKMYFLSLFLLVFLDSTSRNVEVYIDSIL